MKKKQISTTRSGFTKRVSGSSSKAKYALHLKVVLLGVEKRSKKYEGDRIVTALRKQFSFLQLASANLGIFTYPVEQLGHQKRTDHDVYWKWEKSGVFISTLAWL